MSQARLTLDNPAFQGTLRYTRRSVAYEPRSVQARTIQDIVTVRRRSPEGVRPAVDVARTITAHQADRDVQAKRLQTHMRPHPAQPAAAIHPRSAVKKRRKRLHVKQPFHRQSLLYVAAIIVFGMGMYGGITGIQANKRVDDQVKTLQKQAVKAATTSTPSTPAAPTPTPDEPKVVPPSTVKPAPTVVRTYTVPPANPRYLDIPKLKVHGRVLALGVDRKNELKAPYGIYDAGWYDASAKPGENGAMLVDGHSGIGRTRGIFHDLTKLVPGDDIVVQRGDGQTFTYKVVDVKVQDVGQVDMSTLLVSADTAKPGLNLITCAGDQIPGTFSLKQRVVVRAVLA